MSLTELRRRFDYHYWANARLLGAIASLGPDQFTQHVAGSYGSVRNTMVHVMSAEWGWLDRCGGFKRGAKLDPANYPTLDSLTAQWSTVEAHVRSFLASLSDVDLDREVRFAFGGPEQRSTVGHLMEHAANHAVHHRGQVALMIRMLGAVPGDFDLLYFDAADRR